MARVRWNKATLPSYVDSMYSNTADWEYIRKSPELIAMFHSMGQNWVDRLNSELHAAQRTRKQPIADGYKHAISIDSDRIRMRVWAFTARAMAHEAKHQSILKLMKVSGFDVNRKGKARWDWGGSKKKGRGGSRAKAKPGGTNTRPSGSRPAMDPKREASLRRRLVALDILSERGATEGERGVAAEKARRLRSELGE